ncbi:hypothetical protein A5746_14400 [Mycolicibacterium conceptionense]|uniref:Uncharacterized protein n=1 Tax=Mycolicibacterium conceptionense TaxID=451644 RepID=A0A1A1X5R6_9MYCO|nr:hypothetical protein A5726_25105 [Mycolicibacterium conceptionense]OBF31668.1 hypothetical protein A5720_27940 [Mycolicibacterium conceptionense]OBH97058.1 hypothetical protein A5716_16985 [Mycolicibacterium conceptionense]OMB98526.1 hypothetical protein A5746_14400 [Mycolicibacterium conceptionense]
MIVIVAVAVVAALSLAGLVAYTALNERPDLQALPVGQAVSDNPNVAAFYRDLDSRGMGRITVSDARDWAEEACDGDPLAAWRATDFSMAESIEFASAATKVCGDLDSMGDVPGLRIAP